MHIPVLFSCVSQESAETVLGNRSHGLQSMTNAVSAAVLTGPDTGRDGRVDPLSEGSLVLLLLPVVALERGEASTKCP